MNLWIFYFPTTSQSFYIILSDSEERDAKQFYSKSEHCFTSKPLTVGVQAEVD